MPRRKKVNPDPVLPVPVEAMRHAHRQITEVQLKKSYKYRKYGEKSKSIAIRLKDWEYRLAEWYAGERMKRKMRGRVPFIDLATQARVYQTQLNDPDWPAERPFTRLDWNHLSRRKEFFEYVDILCSSMVEAAKRKLEDHSLSFVDNHLMGMDLAVEAKDYRQIYKYTTPALDRIAPVKQQAQVTAVQIVLSPQQQAALDTALPIIEAEVVND